MTNADNPPRYDTGAIRELLLAAFTAETLRRLCQDRAEFRPVLKDVGADPSLNELADQILTHCETHLLFDQLLTEVRQQVPRQYERFEPRLLLPKAISAEVPCPYRGLEVFYAEHAANYFGREAMVAKLLDKLDETNFVAVVGPSGCGKSSLVRAGMVPALRKGNLTGSAAWRVEAFLPGDNPLRALALTLVRLLMPDATPVDSLAEARKLADHLREGTLPVADMLTQLKSQYPDNPRLVLVADQFEEAFTLCGDEAQRRTFLQTLLQAAEMPWVMVLFTLRADFYGRVLEDEAFGRRVDAGLVNVLPMSREDRRAAVERPALRAGRRFEGGLVERILDAVEGSAGDLPLLEFALTELWGRQRADGLLTHQAYEEIGEVRGAIARSADDTFARFSSDEQQAVRAIFTRLVRVARPDEGAEDTRRRITLDELPAEDQILVKSLADARLLVTGRDPRGEGETVEVAHEALIRGWGPLQEWLNRDREFLLWRQRLGTLAHIWAESGRGEGALLRDALLEEARVRSAGRLDELSTLERAYLEGSEAAARQAEAAREAARQRELAQAQRLRQRNRFLVVALIVAALAAVGAGLFFFREREAREEQAAEAQRARAGELAALSTQQLDKRLDRALLLGIEAFRQNDLLQTRQALFVVWSHNPQLSRFLHGHSDLAMSVAWSADGRLASGSSDGTIVVWDLQRSLPAQTLERHSDWVYSVAWSADGRLASASDDGTVIVWDLQRGLPAQTLEGHSASVMSVAWSGDRRLASGSNDGTVIVWDLVHSLPDQTLEGHSDGVWSVAWSGDGRLASGSADGTVIVWDLERSLPGQTLEGHSDWVASVAWSGDGQLASGSYDGTVILWNLQHGLPAQILEERSDWVASVAWSADGRLASGSNDGTVIVWNLQRGLPDRILDGHSGSVESVAWSADGQLASGSGDGGVIIWDLERSLPAQILEGHLGPVQSVAWSDDGRLASGSNDGVVIVWDLQRGLPAQTLVGHSDWVTSVAWSPDGRLVSRSSYGTVIVWDLERGLPAQTLEGHSGSVESVAWSADGRLASGSYDGSVVVWDLERGLPDQTLEGHSGSVLSVAWSADGRLASGSSHGTVIVWDLERGLPAQTLEGHSDWVTSVAWSGDGRLASGSGDGTVQVWQMMPEEWIRQACQRAGRNLTQAEWRLYFPDEEYRKTCDEWLVGK